jgi:quercetin dioxygenase-like cupin family protein
MRSGEEIKVGDLSIRFMVEGDADAEAAAVFEFTVPPGAKVPAAHRHDGYVETIYGLEGTLTWTVEGEEATTGVGEALRIPRGAAHRFDNRGDSSARALAIVTPGVLGPTYFRELAAALEASDGPPDQEAIAAVMRRHGLSPA